MISTAIRHLVMILLAEMASFVSFFKTHHFSVISECHKTLEYFKISSCTTCYKMLEGFQNEGFFMSLKNHNKKGKPQIYLKVAFQSCNFDSIITNSG